MTTGSVARLARALLATIVVIEVVWIVFVLVQQWLTNPAFGLDYRWHVDAARRLLETGTPYWPWARLLGRVFGLDMATCPLCRRGSLRLIAVITQESVITRILRHLQLASVPPPIAPARARQELFAFD